MSIVVILIKYYSLYYIELLLEFYYFIGRYAKMVKCKNLYLIIRIYFKLID